MENDLKKYRFGIVALIGPPNAGKSTFLNQVIGEKVAIVTSKPQTTRNQITGILTDDSMQIIFLDTPGIHEHGGRMNDMMVRSAWSGLHAADLVFFMLDAVQYVKKPGRLKFDLNMFSKRMASLASPVIIGLNKVDMLEDKKSLLPVMQAVQKEMDACEIFPLSASKGEGVAEIIERFRSALPAGEALYPSDQLSTLSLKFMASEIIREKLFLNLHRELPYNLAVSLETWDEDDQLVRMEATILVSRSSHKPIVIGKKGEKLKQVGSQARRELEDLLEKKVFLNLWVKIKPKWNENPSLLNSLGLEG